MKWWHLRRIGRDLRLAWRQLRDPRVPLGVKLVPLLFLGYVLWPLDLIADAVPVLGQLDDLGVLLLGLRVFLRLAARDAAPDPGP